MSRFRLIGVGLIMWVASLSYALWWPIVPTVGPEPPKPHITRGPPTEAQFQYQVWLERVKLRQASMAATSVTVDLDMVTFTVGVLTAMTLLLALLSKYLIAPMVAKQINDLMLQISGKFVSAERIQAHLDLDEERHTNIMDRLTEIAEKVK